MRIKKIPTPKLSKARTGIEGFDEITHGGLPCGRTTLLGGGPGSGKTIMALQTLVNGARMDNEPGIFVAFEESSERIVANAATFGWDLPELQKKKPPSVGKSCIIWAEPSAWRVNRDRDRRSGSR